MIGSSDNSGGVVVGALMCRTECSRFKSCFILLIFLHFSKFFLNSRRISVHNKIHNQ